MYIEIPLKFETTNPLFVSVISQINCGSEYLGIIKGRM